MNKTDIEWTTFSANPLKYRRKSDGKVVWGCVKISPGCAHCYSEAIALRFERGKLFNARNMDELEPFLDEQELREMRTRETCAKIPVSGSLCFVGDMTDIFGEWVPDELLNRLFSGVFELRSSVTWQLLTKRAHRMHRYLSWRWGGGRIVPRNIHVGVSVEDQQRADERIPHLLATPAKVRFLSCEPLLGPIEFDANLHNLYGGIHWCIIGCESGRGRRPMQTEWAEAIARQCSDAGVNVFMKQMAVDSSVTGDVERFPLPLQVREFPGA